MKKLYKNTDTMENSVQAYACTWKCGCPSGCGDYTYDQKSVMSSATTMGTFTE